MKEEEENVLCKLPAVVASLHGHVYNKQEFKTVLSRIISVMTN